MSSSYRTEQIFVTRSVKRALEVLSAQQTVDTDLPLGSNVDAIANQVLSDWLNSQPGMAEREAKIRAFFRTLA